MRRSALLLLLQLAAAAPLAAQFEGTVSMKVSGTGAQGEMNMKMVFKGDQQATILTMPASSPMPGAEMRMVFDPKTNTATTLIPIPPQMQQSPMFANAKGMKMVMDLSKASATVMNGSPSDETVDIRKLGTSEKIAGVDCDDYEITSSKGQPMRACIAQSLGHFLFPQMGGGMGRGPSNPPPVWSKAFGTKPGFPLKVWSPSGEVAMEVTSIEKGSVPSDLFEIPDGYIDMSAMMRGRGGR